MSETQIRHTYKDSLFRMIFRERTELLSLYNAMNESDYENPEELEIFTIEDVIYMGMKNDSAFLIDDVLNLYEAQSTWNPNMPLRGLFYFSKLYQGYVDKNHLDCYSNVRLKLPLPQYVVFYNGMRGTKDRETLRLSDSYTKNEDGAYALECAATLININYGHNKEIMQSCRKLEEYSYLVEEVRKNLKGGRTLAAAVDRAVDACIAEGILEDFLRMHRAEVTEMLLTEYDEELHIKSEKELSYCEGKIEGEVLGEARIVRNKLADGLFPSQVAELLGLKEDYVCRLAELFKQFPDETAAQIAGRYLASVKSQAAER